VGSALAAHAVDRRPPRIVHAPPARIRILTGVGPVDRGLAFLELVPLGDDCARLLEATAQLVGPRIGLLDLRPPHSHSPPAPDETQPDSARDAEPAEEPGKTSPQEGRCYTGRLLAPPSRRPSRAAPAGGADSVHGKEVVGSVTAYELMLMLDPELAEERQTEIVDRARQLIERSGGSVSSHDAWGRRRLAFEIDHKQEGVYHLVLFDAEPETLDELTRVLKITDGVMRHLAVRRVKGSRPRTAVRTGDYATNTRSAQEEEEQ
jgi:small subunit ribosomal protein S6